MYILAEISCLL